MCKSRYWYDKPRVTFCRCSLCQGSGLLAKAFSLNLTVNQSFAFCISFCLNRLSPPLNRYLFLKPCPLHLPLKMCPGEAVIHQLYAVAVWLNHCLVSGGCVCVLKHLILLFTAFVYHRSVCKAWGEVQNGRSNISVWDNKWYRPYTLFIQCFFCFHTSEHDGCNVVTACFQKSWDQ